MLNSKSCHLRSTHHIVAVFINSWSNPSCCDFPLHPVTLLTQFSVHLSMKHYTLNHDTSLLLFSSYWDPHWYVMCEKTELFFVALLNFCLCESLWNVWIVLIYLLGISLFYSPWIITCVPVFISVLLIALHLAALFAFIFVTLLRKVLLYSLKYSFTTH